MMVVAWDAPAGSKRWLWLRHRHEPGIGAIVGAKGASVAARQARVHKRARFEDEGQSIPRQIAPKEPAHRAAAGEGRKTMKASKDLDAQKAFVLKPCSGGPVAEICK